MGRTTGGSGVNWEHLLDKYGWPSLFLALVLAAIWIIGRPVVKRLLDMIDAQLSESRAVRAKDTQDFLGALDAQRKLSERQTDVFADALKRLDEHRGRK